MSVLPSKFQMGDRVAHSDTGWANVGKPATVTGVTIYSLGQPSYMLTYDTPSEHGVISSYHIEERFVTALVGEPA